MIPRVHEREAVLARLLPLDLARHVLALAAATTVQATARGMLARAQRPPLERGGFHFVDQGANGLRTFLRLRTNGAVWTYRCTHTHGTLLPRLHAWARHWRPGAYALELSATLADGTVATIGSLEHDRLLVTPHGLSHDTVGAAWRMYMHAVTPFHGPPAGALVRIALAR